jgi:tetratricopeptide (TPR) repeat protein
MSGVIGAGNNDTQGVVVRNDTQGVVARNVTLSVAMKNEAPNTGLTVLLCGAALCIAMTSAGCSKLQARDHLNQGVNAFKTGSYSTAADQFRLAIDADPTFSVARLYLATAYEQQYVPGTDTPENKKFWNAAMDEFQNVLKDDPNNGQNVLLATQSIASLYFHAGDAKGPDQADDMAKAEEWDKKVVAIDPKNKEAYYTLGVIPWLEFLTPDREARNADGMTPEELHPLKADTKGKTLKADLKAKFWQPLTDGIESEKKALDIDPNYEDAMSYMSLLLRYRADLEDTQDAYMADVKQADDWMQKDLETKKKNAAKKAAAAEAGGAPPE